MIRIKSFSVDNGDMFYINHGSDNFSIIDCCLPNDDRKEQILKELEEIKKSNGITRFISTHPDQDHISGLKELDESIDILNFYCIENNATKEESTIDFEHYLSLKNSEKTFFMYKDCKRKWMNRTCDERWSSWINILWPNTDNEYFQEALTIAKEGGSPNNISPIIKYSLEQWATFMWLWDLETEFMENIKPDVELPKVHILFAPHHWRKSWKIPSDWLEKMNPDIIIIWEAPSWNINYYEWYNTITQNSAKNITFYLSDWVVNIYAGNENYKVDFLNNHYLEWNGDEDEHYIGTLDTSS